MSIASKLIEAFRPYNHERASANKLKEARLMLVEHECAREYHMATCSMLKQRISRLESASAPQAERKDSLLSIQPIVKPNDWDARNGMHHIEPAPADTSALARILSRQAKRTTGAGA